MAKAVVYALLLTATFIFFLFLSPKKQHGLSINGQVSRRLGQNFHIPTFDPLVTKIDRLAQAKGLLSKNTHNDPVNNNNLDDGSSPPPSSEEEHEEDSYEEYLGGEGKLNTTMRLYFLFPLLDTAPKDGVVSLKELQTWMIQQTEDNLGYRTAKELKTRDKDGDGAISFSEYLPQFSQEDIERGEMGHGEAGWWKQQFLNADFDHNGSLDLEEFNNFLHPEDSRNGDIQRWVLKERITGVDYNGDGKLEYKEFHEHAYGMYKEYVKFETEGDYVPTAQLLFAELDKNKDRFLVAEELRPILHYLQPGEMSYAKYYSSFLIHQADDNKDGNLSLEEMLNHEDVFYKAVYHEDMDDDYDDFHDEL